MVYLFILLSILSQSESSIKIPLQRENSRKLASKFSLPTNDIAFIDKNFTLFYLIYGNFSIGTPPQNFRLQISLEHSFLNIENGECDNCAKVNKHQFYPSNSSTFEDLNIPINLTEKNGYYDNQNSIEEIVKDIVKVGNYEVESYFVLTTYKDDYISLFIVDGTIGFALSGLSDGYPTYMDSLKSAGVIDKKIISLYINEGSEPENFIDKSISNLEIGGYDLDAYSSTEKVSLTVPITMDDYLGSDLFDIYFDGYILENNASLAFYIESGLLLVNHYHFDKIIDYLEYNSNYNCTNIDSKMLCLCDDINSMPIFDFKYDGNALKLNPHEFWYKNGETCELMIVKSENENWYIGLQVFHNYYTIFDLDNKEIRFYPSVSSTNENEEDEIIQPFFKNSGEILLVAAFSLISF